MHYLIWSYRKRAWYAAGAAGYATSVAGAGRFDREDALRYVVHALPGQLVAVDEKLADMHFAGLDADGVEAKLGSWRRL